MGVRVGYLRAVLVTIGLLAILLSALPATASALTEVRFLHVVPGAPEAELELSSDRAPAVDLPSTGFAEVSDYGEVVPGPLALSLTADGKQIAELSEQVEDAARYTVVAARDGKRIVLRVYRDGDATAGDARWRMVHVASEVKDADIEVDGKDLGSLSPRRATGYRDIEPGDHEFAITQPGGGSALVSTNESLVAGTSATAYLVGSGGEPTRFVLAQDDAATPDQAPETGLGGLAREPRDRDASWLGALLAAVLAGALGGLAYTRLAERGRARA